jgi:hypothetical protein
VTLKAGSDRHRKSVASPIWTRRHTQELIARVAAPPVAGSNSRGIGHVDPGSLDPATAPLTLRRTAQ